MNSASTADHCYTTARDGDSDQAINALSEQDDVVST